MGDDRSKPPPLERRVPGATRAGPASPARPELPEALLQRMQAVVKAAHAQALQEEEAQRGRGAQPDQDASPEAPASLPRCVPGTAGAPKEPNGVPWRKLPTVSPGRFSDEDAEFDTDPFLPRLTASGTIASSPANSTSAQPNHTAQQNHSSQQNQEAQQNHSTRKHANQQNNTVKPGHALRQDRALRRRDRRATKRERATQAERERTEQEQVAQAERAERERAEQERATRAEQERAEWERAQAERAEQERAAQAERERAAQAERERPEQAAATEGTAGTEQDVAERAGPAQPAAAPVQAEPGPTASPPSTAKPASVPVPDSTAAPGSTAEPDGSVPPTDRGAAAVRTPAKQSGRPSLSVRKAPRHRRYRTAALAIGVAAALAAGPLALMLSRSSPAKLSAAEVTSDQAATWVAQQVNSSAVVSCDLAMCQTLRGDGVPVGDLLVMGPKARDLLNSQVIVSTAAIRNLFGSRLDSVYAPTVLASFGSGKARVDVRVIAPDGAAAYLTGLRADLQQRKGAGGALAVSHGITLSPLARRQMASGQVAAQLMIVITSLATIHPLDILAFGDLAPGASPGVPLRSVTVAENGGAAIVRQMLASLREQPSPYRAAHIETTQRNRQRVLVIEFAAPMPLGLINGPNG
jgi:hypothetical protein